MKADLIAYDKDGQLAVIIEIKNRIGTSKEWATRMRRNIYAHGSWPKTPYFLLALPDRFYLWRNAGNAPERIEPDYEVDSGRLLGPYYEKSGLSPTDLSHDGFELLVTSWLNQVMQDGASSLVQQNRDWLVDSGLFESIKKGHLVSEAGA